MSDSNISVIATPQPMALGPTVSRIDLAIAAFGLA